MCSTNCKSEVCAQRRDSFYGVGLLAKYNYYLLYKLHESNLILTFIQLFGNDTGFSSIVG